MITTAAHPLMAVHGRASVTVQRASCRAVPGTTILRPSVPRPATGTMPRIGTSTSGSGLPGRFRNSESVTSSIFTSLPLGGEPREEFSPFWLRERRACFAQWTLPNCSLLFSQLKLIFRLVWQSMRVREINKLPRPLWGALTKTFA